MITFKRSKHRRMAITICTLILGLVILQPCKTLSQTQWTTNGTNINSANSGNVGIGTNTPEHKLTVQDGNIAVKTTNNVVNGIIGEIGFGAGYYTTALSSRIRASYEGAPWYRGSNLSFFTELSGDVTDPNNLPLERMRITGAGNVGIGTTAPAYKLDVAGPINATGFYVNGAPLQVGGGGGSQWTTNSSSVYYNNGNVGIGTTSPGSQLFVGSGTPSVTTLPGLNVALGSNSYISASNGAVNTFIGSDTSSYGIVGTLSNHALGLRANNTLAMTILPSGNIGVGTTSPTAKLDVNGDANITGNINVTGNINAKYQDVAEWVPTHKTMPAGTVAVLDATQSNYVTSSSKSYDTKVAGVVSARPGIALGESGANKVLVATTGRVKVKADATHAPIHVGDLLVTGTTEGMAMKSEPLSIGGAEIHRPGTLIGKALEPLEKGTGEILVLLSLQ